MSGIAAFVIIGTSAEELIRNVTKALINNDLLSFEAKRSDDPGLTPILHSFTVYIESIHNEETKYIGVKNIEDGAWFQIEINPIGTMTFDLIT